MRSLWILFLCLASCQARSPQSFTPEHLWRDISWPNPPQEISGEKAKQLLNQKFTHLGYGTQAVAFLGEDGTTVLKFFLRKSLKGKKRISLPSLRGLLFAAQREKIKKQRAIDVLRRYAAAYRDLRAETAILYTHLDPAEEDLGSVTVKGIDGQTHVFSLKTFPFILQKKVEPIGERAQREKLPFAAIQIFLHQRACKGFYERKKGPSINLFANYGLIESTVIMLDPGNLEYSEKQRQNPSEEIKRLNSRFEFWKQEHFGSESCIP